jgi:hypothetical protein
MLQGFQNQIAFDFGNGATNQTDQIGHSRRPPRASNCPHSKICARQVLPAPPLPAPWLAAG